MRFQIVIEGTDFEEIHVLWEEIQNKYNLFDNCVLREISDKDSIIDSRCDETGIKCAKP